MDAELFSAERGAFVHGTLRSPESNAGNRRTDRLAVSTWGCVGPLSLLQGFKWHRNTA